VLSSPTGPPEGYRLALCDATAAFGDGPSTLTPPALIASVAPHVRKAWPAVLVAAAAAAAAAPPVAQDAAGGERHTALLDACLAAMCQAAASLAAVEGDGRKASEAALGAASAALLAMKRLTEAPFVEAGWVGGEVASELLVALRALCEDVLVPCAASGQLPPGRAASAAPAAAACLRQLCAAGAQGSVAAAAAGPHVFAVARALLEASAGDATSIEAALGAVAFHVQTTIATSTDGCSAAIPALHEALSLGIDLLKDCSDPASASSVVRYMLGLAAAVPLQLAKQDDIPSAADVVAAAAAELAGQCAADVEAGDASRLEASAGCMLGLAGCLPSGAEQPSAAATDAAAGDDTVDDDWDDAAFEGADEVEEEEEEAANFSAAAKWEREKEVEEAIASEADVSSRPYASTQRACSDAFSHAVSSRDPAVRHAALCALTGFLKRSAASGGQDAAIWGVHCAALALPGAASQVRQVAVAARGGEIGAGELEVGFFPLHTSTLSFHFLFTPFSGCEYILCSGRRLSA
jgi:hypothetical protein